MKTTLGAAKNCDAASQLVEKPKLLSSCEDGDRFDGLRARSKTSLTRRDYLDMPWTHPAMAEWERSGTAGGAMRVADRSMPVAEANGWVATLNKMGFMGKWLDPFSQAFVDHCAKTRRPVLDIGAAYGLTTLPALAAGARVIANDCDEHHLAILEHRTPAVDRERLTLKPGSVPDGVRIESDSLDAIVCSRVIHFFTIPDLLKTADAMWRWLSPGGKVFIIEDTPFLANSLSIMEEYERRRRQGEPWPGFFDDVRPFRKSRNEWCPPIFHFFDEVTLTRVFQQAGFTIERCEQFRRDDYPADVQLDGREGIGLVACKKMIN